MPQLVHIHTCPSQSAGSPKQSRNIMRALLQNKTVIFCTHRYLSSSSSMRSTKEIVRTLSRSAQQALKSSTSPAHSSSSVVAAPSPAVACPHSVDATQPDHVRPYSEVPGPRPLPLLGNTWRYVYASSRFMTAISAGAAIGTFVYTFQISLKPVPRAQIVAVRWPVSNIRSGARLVDTARRVRAHRATGWPSRSAGSAVRVRCGRN